MSGDLDTMEQWLRAAEAAIAAGAQDPNVAGEWADTEDLRMAPATISIYRASLAQARHDVAGTVRHARQALDLAGPEDHLIRGQGGAFLALAAWADGDIALALETFGSAVRSLQAAGSLVDEMDATIVLADMWIALGRPSRARELYERSLQRATADGEPYPRATADLHVGLAELDRNWMTSPASGITSRRHECSLNERPSPRTGHRWYVRHGEVAPLPVTRRGGGYSTGERCTGAASTPRSAPSRHEGPWRSQPGLVSASEWSRSRGVSVGDDRTTCASTSTSPWCGFLAEGRRTPSDPSGRRRRRRWPLWVSLTLHAAAERDGKEACRDRALQALTHDALRR
jgi:LuxR family maltose regulon positive regulatory protein